MHSFKSVASSRCRHWYLGSLILSIAVKMLYDEKEYFAEGINLLFNGPGLHGNGRLILVIISHYIYVICAQHSHCLMMWMVCDIQVQTLKIIFVVDKIRLGLDNCNRLTQSKGILKKEMNLKKK